MIKKASLKLLLLQRALSLVALLSLFVIGGAVGHAQGLSDVTLPRAFGAHATSWLMRCSEHRLPGCRRVPCAGRPVYADGRCVISAPL